MSTPNHRATSVLARVANTEAPATARAKSIALEEQAERRRGAIALSMRTATGLSQTAYAELIGTSRHIVDQHESGEKSPNIRHLLDAPDEAFDAFLAGMLAERKRRGFAAREVIAAPEVVHTCEHERTNAVVVELSDVMRARAMGAAPHVQAKEVREAIETLTELLAATTEG